MTTNAPDYGNGRKWEGIGEAAVAPLPSPYSPDYRAALINIWTHSHARNGSPEQDEKMLLAIREIARETLGLSPEDET